LFNKYIKITDQNLPKKIELIKNKNEYILYVDTFSISLKRDYYKNPTYTLMNNGEIYCTISCELTGLIETPYVYEVFINDSEVDYIYTLIRIIIELPPSMGTS
jgi:hypothetical protein